MSGLVKALDSPNEQSPLLESQRNDSDKDVNDNQRYDFSRGWLFIVITSLAVVQFTSFFDQTAIYTAVPAIAASLQTGSSTSWIGTSFLITSMSIQLINGRLSDIFGRKACLMTALTIMALGNTISGFSHRPATLFASRAISGLGAGALNALVQIAVSDLTTLKQRGYYFGFIGIATALGNGLGPFLGGTLAEKLGWRWTFLIISPLAVVALTYLALVFPRPKTVTISGSKGHLWIKLRDVDWFGVAISIVAIILISLVLSQGGSVYSWSSPPIVAMAIGGIALFVIFISGEFFFVRSPMLPRHLFSYGRSTNTLLAMNVIIGWVFMGNLFYVPLYFQIVCGWSSSKAGLLILPITIAHGVTSGVTGILVAVIGQYMPIISTGAIFWVVGAAAKAFYGFESPKWMFVLFGICEGIGVGSSLQPVLVGLLAGSQTADRAVITGLRNFLRDIGGALGISISGAIWNMVVQRRLSVAYSPARISQLTSSAYMLADHGLSEEEHGTIAAAYLDGFRVVFASYAVLIACLFICSLSVRDYGLARGSRAKDIEYSRQVQEE